MSTRFETSERLPQYFKHIDPIAIQLSKQEELDLADRIQAGDEKAMHYLVQANLKFVVTLANKFIGMGLSIDDLIQEGNAGLVDAAYKFTSDKNVKFITYAQFHIRKRLNLSICEYGRTVRLPVNQEYDIYKRKMKGESFNLSNIAIDKPISEENSNTIGDLILRTEAVDMFEDQDKQRILKYLLAKLKDSDREIIGLFYGLEGDGISTKEIALIVGKTAVEVNVALKHARTQMRKAAHLC